MNILREIVFVFHRCWGGVHGIGFASQGAFEKLRLCLALALQHTSIQCSDSFLQLCCAFHLIH